MTIQEEKELYSVCDNIAEKFFRKFYILCKKTDYDLEDIQQICKTKSLSTILKFKDKPLEELKKLVAQKTIWVLYQFRYRKLFYDKNYSSPKKDVKKLYEKEIKQNEKNVVDGVGELSKTITYKWILEDIKKIFPLRTYYIIWQRFNGKEFPEIAKDLNMGETNVFQIYQRAIQKLQQYILTEEGK